MIPIGPASWSRSLVAAVDLFVGIWLVAMFPVFAFCVPVRVTRCAVCAANFPLPALLGTEVFA